MMILAEACNSSKNNFIDVEGFKYAAVYDLMIPDALHDVLKN